MKHILISVTAGALASVTANAALTTTLVNGGIGSVTDNGGGSFTLNDDTTAGDIWNGGDTFTYLHEDARVNQSFTATVRVVGQTEDAAGRWGKSGLMVRSGLGANDSNALTLAVAGIGSQVNVPSVGAHDPVPLRLSGRTNNDGQGGFEVPIQDAMGVDVPNNVFPEGQATNQTWLSLSWDADTNEFISGAAPDVAGAPGTWAYSAGKTDIARDAAGWYVGMGYSAHNDMTLLGSGAEGQHGITFDNFSIDVVPEPSTTALGLGALALFALRRRR